VVHVLVNPHFTRPVRNLLDGCAGALEHVVEVQTYPAALTRLQLPAGAYVFADLDRVPAADAAAVAALWRQLDASGRAMLTNDPRRVLRRYALLRTLFDMDVNVFNVYRPSDDLRHVRFPVFVRCEHDHGGPRTPLLYSAAALHAALERLGRRRAWRGQLIVTECRAEPNRDGLYRKYGALLVNGRIIPSHLIAGRSWLVKGKFRVTNDELAKEELTYVVGNPHADLLLPIFEAARIGYGRIDYGFVGGRVQVYEINTNPTIMGRGPAPHPGRRPKRATLVQRLVEAFRDLDARALERDRSPIVVEPRRGVLPAWMYRQVRSVQGLAELFTHRTTMTSRAWREDDPQA
jgi:hypothetical protein